MSQYLNSSKHDKPDEYDENNLDALITLKFTIEREINTLYETFHKVKTLNREIRIKNLDIHTIFTIYQNNIDTQGDLFMQKQTELLNSIDALLLKNCKHNWIDDIIDGPFSSRDYCYCSKCFIRK